MNSKEYWEQREAEALKHYIKDEKEYDKRLKQIYTNMLNNVQSEIDGFYGRYASKNGITIAEAKKAVKTADMAAYKYKAKKYVKEKDFSKQANEEMALYNLTMKVNRLEMLKANIGLELIAGHDELQKFMGGILKGRTMDELKRQAGILGKSIQNNAKTANAIVNASFHNAKFSDRIWLYQDLLRADLDKILQNGLISGKNPRLLAREIKDKFNTSTFNAERLMRTELARVQTDAQKKSFEENGFEMYTFHTNTGCCDICAELDGKHFKVKDMMPGTNAAPMHPHCRCSTSAYEDSEEYERWLDFLANGGTTEEYNKLKAQPKAKAKQEEKQTKNKTVEQPATNDVTQFTKEQSKALEWYVSGEGMFINEYLRGRVGADFGELSSSEKERIKLITEATDRTLPKDIKTLYRSVDASAIFGKLNWTEWENIEGGLLYNDKFSMNKAQALINKTKGKTITEKGFMSTSKEYDVVAEWGGFTGSEMPIVLEFDVPAGTKGADLAKFEVEGDEQYEVLLARNTEYEIEDISAKDGNIYIKAKIKKQTKTQ